MNSNKSSKTKCPYCGYEQQLNVNATSEVCEGCKKIIVIDKETGETLKNTKIWK